MSLQVYPTVRGLTFQGKRTPEFQSLVQQGSSGREVRLAYYTDPLWHWELNYNYLKDNPNDLISGYTDTDLVTLQGFFLQAQGRLQPFLFDDVTPGFAPGTGPWDSVYGQAIASGDGTTDIFQLIRTTGGFVESIQSPYTAPPPTVYLNGVVQSYGSQYAVDDVGHIVFVTPPALGVNITADFSYYWAVRFDDDMLEFDTMMYLLWELKQIKLVQIRL